MVPICVFLLIFFFSPSTKVYAATTYTICDSGCDFVTLTAALTFPGLSNNNLQFTSGYVFNPVSEGTFLFIPDNVLVECLPGADIFGDALQSSIQLNPGSDVTIQNCTFENVNFDDSGKTNVQFLDNTFSSAAASQLVFTVADGYTISGNTGIQHVQVQKADNGIIENNTFECRFNNGCMSLVTAGGGPFDYSSPADVSVNIAISNNKFSNYNTSSGGDYVYIGAGINIDFTDNTILSAVTIDDVFITMVTDQNAEAYFANNYFIFPDKIGGAFSGTWGLNLRVGPGDINVLADHNTFIMTGNSNMLNGSACIGVFDDGTNPVPNVNLEFNYNLCDNISSNPGGFGVTLNYFPATINLSVTDSNNGFGHIASLINDSNSIFTSLAATTLTLDPVLRSENASATDDYFPVPMSRYLDVNGTQDIGAFSGVRVSNYTIDDNCTVNYSSCFSHLTSILNDVLKDGDVVTVKAGTYPPIVLDHAFNNITIQGEGAGTVIDATTGGNGISLSNVNNSKINNLTVKNAIVASITYHMFSWAMSASGTDYDQNSDGSNHPNALYIDALNCGGAIDLAAPFLDVTGELGIGTDDINLVLVHLPDAPFDQLLTVYIPDSVATDPANLSLNCGVPLLFIEHFVPNIFAVQPGGTYIYDSAAVASAGITILGDSSNPFLTRTNSTVTSFNFINSSSNTLSNITFANNVDDVHFDANSNSNNFIGSHFSGSIYTIVSNANADNSLQDSYFDLSKLQVNSSGKLKIYYSVKATVHKAGSSTPIKGVSVLIKNKNHNSIQTLVTNSAGVTPFSNPVLSTIIGSGDVLSVNTGGLNPFNFTAHKTGFNTKAVSSNLNTPFQNVVINLSEGDLTLPAETPLTIEPTTTPTEAPIKELPATGKANSADSSIKLTAGNYLCIFSAGLAAILIIFVILKSKQKRTQQIPLNIGEINHEIPKANPLAETDVLSKAKLASRNNKIRFLRASQRRAALKTMQKPY